MSGCCNGSKEWGSHPDLKEADALFEKGTFAEALEAYEEVYGKTKKENVKWMAFFRICESLTHLYRYGDAAQKLLDTPLPEKMPHRARILILRTELLQNFLRQYSHIQSNDVIEGEEGGDVFRKTPADVKEEIRKAYGGLWEVRSELAAMNVEDEGYYMDLEGVDLGAYPTMFDYVVFNFSEYLLNFEATKISGKAARPSGEELIAGTFDRPVNLDDPPALLAAEIMEEAAGFETKKREEAAERWKVRRLMLPVRRHVFDLKDPEKAGEKAKDILKGWFESFDTKGGAAEAGYEAAFLLNARMEYVEAVELCSKVESKGSGTYAAHEAMLLRSNIQDPWLDLRAKTVMPPGKGAITVVTRNLDKVYFRAYKTDPDEVRKAHDKLENYWYGWSGLFGSLRPEWAEKFVDRLKPVETWKASIDDTNEYKEIFTTVDPPDLDIGIYIILASIDKSFSRNKSLLQGCFLNVTDLVLVGTSGVTGKTRGAYYEYIGNRGPTTVNDEVIRFYTHDATSGEAAAGVSMDVFTQVGGQRQDHKLETDGEGAVPMAFDVSLHPPQKNEYGYYDYGYGNNYNIDPLARKGESSSYWASTKHLSFMTPESAVVFLETDRPIYRPGHEVKVKVVAVKRTSDGFRTVEKKRSVTLTAYDPNRKEFFSEKVKLGELGSGSVTFKVPEGKLLGRYSLRAEYHIQRYNGFREIQFSVEEYKQPEFEITLEPAREPWKYGKPVTIKGSAKYYFGGPVADASISFIIKRSMVVPWYYRYWFMDGYSSSDEEIATGEMKTDAKGDFTIELTPTAPPMLPYQRKLPDIAQFVVDVDGRDSGGRTIAAQETYKAGKNALYFVLEPQGGFFMGSDKASIDAKLLTISDAPQEGESRYEVFRLADGPTKPLEDIDQYNKYGGSWGWVPPLDLQLEDAANGDKVAEGETRHGEDGVGKVVLEPLAAGAYRIVQTTKDKWGGEVKQERVFIVAPAGGKGKVPVNAASVTLAEKEEYRVGDEARFVIGSGLGSGIYRIEIWAGDYFVKSELLDSGPEVKVITIPVTEQLKGGFALRWYGVKGLDVHFGQEMVPVPWKEKKLSVELDPFQEALKPGEKVTWGLKLKDEKGKPVKGEALALMYDRALEYYVTSHNPWMDGLYTMASPPTTGIDSVFMPPITQYPMEESLLRRILKTLKKVPEPPRPPGLRTWRTWAEGRGVGLLQSFRSKDAMFAGAEEGEADMMMEMEAPSPGAPPPTAASVGRAEAKKKGVPGPKQVAQKAAAKVEARKAFADTAFFHPHVVTSGDGRGKFSFTAPEQLTSWRVKLFAFTGDVMEGTLDKEAVTRKELMIRADLPRFFREKDKGTVTVVVHNESEKDLSGNLFIDITENDKNINSKLKLEEGSKKFEVPPHGLASYDWMIEIPIGVGAYKVRVAAVSGKLTDAEERVLPILPSRQRLIESAFASLKGSESKKLEIKLKDDPTRINESMTVQVDPQLTLSLLSTIPFLVEYPYMCVEQILNRYVPMAIVNEIYKKYPEIQKVVGKIPKRDTITPPWEEDDPRRLITLMETPWVRESEGYKSRFPLTDLLDPGIVESQKQITLDQLRAAQQSNGAFPWWPGGRPDPYITLYVLAGFAEARRYGVEVPHDMINDALSYVNDEIPRRLKPEDSYLAITAYAAYVVTSFSKDEFSEAARGHKEAKKWVKFLHEHIHALTPFGKAYLAYTYYRLGDKKKANDVLDMALDGSKEDPIVGVYWAPEKYSWVWYNDTVEKHAFFLRTLQELRPKDKRIPGMVQWLLFNRKGNVWKSTKASSAAVYSLLDYLNKIGALSGKETFKISWGPVRDTVVVPPDEWLEEPLRWIKTGEDILPGMNEAVIDKTGPGIAFASMTWIYSTDEIPEASAPGLLEMKRTFYRRVKEGDTYHLKPVASEEEVQVGDEVVVQLKITSKSAFEYMHLKDPKAAGFEAETLLSGWKYDPLWFYEEPRDSLTNFFMDRVPHGEYMVQYTLRPTKPGTYRVGAAILQSMYAPEMTAHSAGFVIRVVKND